MHSRRKTEIFDGFRSYLVKLVLSLSPGLAVAGGVYALHRSRESVIAMPSGLLLIFEPTGWGSQMVLKYVDMTSRCHKKSMNINKNTIKTMELASEFFRTFSDLISSSGQPKPIWYISTALLALAALTIPVVMPQAPQKEAWPSSSPDENMIRFFLSQIRIPNSVRFFFFRYHHTYHH